MPSRAAFTFLICLLFVNAIQAADIKGHVYDGNSKEQLIGALVTLQPSGAKVFSALDGSFNFKNVAAGNYKLSISYVGFATFDTSITVGTNSLNALNFYLSTSSASLSTHSASRLRGSATRSR